jgi:cytochrome b
VARRRPSRDDVRVWDRFVRIFHWGTAALFFIAFLTPDAKAVHEPVGYVLLGLVGARIVWGFTGGHHARFATFIAAPRTVLRYLRLLGDGRAPRYLGHNPAGGAMILLLLAMLLLVAVSGWMSETDRWFGVRWVGEIHSVAAHLLLILVGVHVAGVVVSSRLHGENLVLAMVTGRKRASPPTNTGASGAALVIDGKGVLEAKKAPPPVTGRGCLG